MSRPSKCTQPKAVGKAWPFPNPIVSQRNQRQPTCQRLLKRGETHRQPKTSHSSTNPAHNRNPKHILFSSPLASESTSAEACRGSFPALTSRSDPRSSSRTPLEVFSDLGRDRPSRRNLPPHSNVGLNPSPALLVGRLYYPLSAKRRLYFYAPSCEPYLLLRS